MAEGVLLGWLLLGAGPSEVGSGVEVLHLHHFQRVLQVHFPLCLCNFLFISLNAILLEVILADARIQQLLGELQRRHSLQLLA